MKRWITFLAFLLGWSAFAASASATEHADKAEGHAATPAAAETGDAPPARHAPVTMTVGVVATELSKFELANGSYNAEILVTVHCDREPCKPDLDFANGKVVGKPEKIHDEPLFKILKLKGELSAVVDLSEYPYDNHALTVVLEDKGDPAQVKLVLDREHTGVRDSIRLPGWDISQWAAEVGEEDVGDGTKISQIHYAILAHRPALMATFKSVIPVVIMIFVAAFTLLLKPKSAAGRLSAATGGLMSVVMFQVGQVGALPPLGYLTRLDKFMLATYVIYLANIAFSVAMVRFDEKKNERLANLSYLVAAGAVPGLALVVWTGVFTRLF